MQILSHEAKQLSLKELAGRLNPVAQVTYNEFMLRFTVDDYEITVFPDGRAIIKNTIDESLARDLYSKFIVDLK